MADLKDKKCIPCSVGADPLTHGQIEEMLSSVSDGWVNEDDKMIVKSFKFKNFKEALDFTNKVGAIAEEEGHHPNIYLAWGEVVVELFTHKIDGLHENDFIMASKIDDIENE